MQIPCGNNPASTAPNFKRILHNNRVSQNSDCTPNPAHTDATLLLWALYSVIR
jgi:hypothetical protein